MFLTDFFICSFCVHQFSDIQFFQSSSCPQKSDPEYHQIDSQRQKDIPYGNLCFQVICLIHGSHKHGRKHLLKKHPRKQPQSKGKASKNQVFPDKHTCQTSARYTQKQISAKFPAAPVCHKPHNISHQPCHDKYNKKCSGSDHTSNKKSAVLTELQNILRKHQ